MRLVGVTGLMVLASCCAARSDPLPSLSELRTLPCKTYNAAVGGILSGLLKAPIIEYLKKDRKDAARVGSACAMLDYVTRTCADHPAYTIEQAVDESIRRVKNGPALPKVASCAG